MARLAQRSSDRVGLRLGVKVAVPLGDARVAQAQERAHDRVDVRIEHARVEVRARLKRPRSHSHHLLDLPAPRQEMTAVTWLFLLSTAGHGCSVQANKFCFEDCPCKFKQSVGQTPAKAGQAPTCPANPGEAQLLQTISAERRRPFTPLASPSWAQPSKAASAAREI